jgi:hypothetical protein
MNFMEAKKFIATIDELRKLADYYERFCDK